MKIVNAQVGEIDRIYCVDMPTSSSRFSTKESLDDALHMRIITGAAIKS